MRKQRKTTANKIEKKARTNSITRSTSIKQANEAVFEFEHGRALDPLQAGLWKSEHVAA